MLRFFRSESLERASSMQIFWHGLSSIRLEAKTGEQEATLLTDPYSNETGLRFPRTVEPDLVVLSHQNEKIFNLEGANGSPYVISNPGEYEVKGIFVQGIQDQSADTDPLRSVVYRFDAEGISLAFLGQMKRRLTDVEIELLGDIDVLLLPVGGGNVLDSKVAADVITLIEPRLVVPLYYELPGIKESLTSVEHFCKQLGVCKRQDATKLKIVKKDLPQDEMIITVLERS